MPFCWSNPILIRWGINKSGVKNMPAQKKLVGQCGHFQGPMTSWCGPRKVLASFPMAWFTWLPWWRSTRRASEIHGMDAVPFWIARDTLGWTVYLKAIKKKNRTYPNTQKDVQNISSKQSPQKNKAKTSSPSLAAQWQGCKRQHFKRPGMCATSPWRLVPTCPTWSPGPWISVIFPKGPSWIYISSP